MLPCRAQGVAPGGGAPCDRYAILARMARRPKRTSGKKPPQTPTEAPRDPWQGADKLGAGPERHDAGAALPAGGADVVAEDPAAKLAAELAGLPPAERYERLIDFPTDHNFKVIGKAEQAFTDALRATLDALGYADVALQPRYSSGANYVAYTVTLRVENGAAMVRIYDELGGVAGLKYLL
jgi:putative lipoic acid-binding regulatory protein